MAVSTRLVVGVRAIAKRHDGLDRKAVDPGSPRALLAAGERGLVGKQLLLGAALWIQPLEPPPGERRLPAGVERGGWRESDGAVVGASVVVGVS
jgi:hypothetical protein